MPDERIEDYRTLGETLVALITDPRGREPAVTYATSFEDDGHGDWYPMTIDVPGLGPAVHCFDVAMTLEAVNNVPYQRVLYACGSRSYTATENATQAALPGFSNDHEYNGAAFVWRSTDLGATWTELLAELKNGDGYYRFYGFGKVGNRLVVAASDRSAYWVVGIDGRGPSAIKHPSTGPGSVPGIYAPPVWSRDETSFYAGGDVGVAWTLDSSGALVSSPPHFQFLRALSAGPEGWLWLDSSNHLRYGPSRDYGRVPLAVDRGCVDPAGRVFVSDGAAIYRVDGWTEPT